MLALAAAGVVALPASADRFLDDPDSCGYTTHHVFHHGNGHTTEIRVTSTSQRFTTCAIAREVAHSFASTAGCHDTRYCHVRVGSYSCHNKFYSGSHPIAHCKALNGASGEAFMTWHRIDR
jgi:hypothetical protein